MIPEAWLVALLSPPMAISLMAFLTKDTATIRAWSLALAVVSCGASVALPLLPELWTLRVEWPWPSQPLLGPFLARGSPLSRLLIALPSVLWLLTTAVTPRARLDRVGLGRTAGATLVGLLSFLTSSPFLLAACWLISSILFVWGISKKTNPRTLYVISGYHLVGGLSLVVGIVLAQTSRGFDGIGLWLIALAVLIRKGILPFHAWIPEAFDRGRIGPTVLFSAPQLGTYVAATLLLPHAPQAMLRTIAMLSLVTAVYGAALALVQTDARRTLGYLFVSQSSLVLAGLDSSSNAALTGALVLWISSALAFTGVARTVLALETRRGRLRLTTHHGGFDQMPLLATSFLLFGLACTGFPGTLGFVGQEMLIDGTVRTFPALGFLTVGASALTGLALLRMYFSLFSGKPGGSIELRLRRREGIVFAGVATALVVAGLFPQGIVHLSRVAGEDLLHRRDATPPLGGKDP